MVKIKNAIPYIEVYVIPYEVKYSDSKNIKTYRSLIKSTITCDEGVFNSSAIAYGGSPIKIMNDFLYIKKLFSEYSENLETKSLLTALIGLYGKVESGLLCSFDTCINKIELKLTKRLSSIEAFMKKEIWQPNNISQKSAIKPVTHQIWCNGLEKEYKFLQDLIKLNPKILKVKLPNRFDLAKESLKLIRQILGGNVYLRIDMNNSMQKDFYKFCELCNSYGVYAIEDGFFRPSIDNLKIMGHFNIRLILDSFLNSIESLETNYLYYEGLANNIIINFKLNRIGGWTRAFLLENKCNKLKIDTLLGCAEEIGDAMQNICFAGYHMKSNIEIEGIGWHRLKKVDRLNQIDVRDGFYHFSYVNNLAKEISLEMDLIKKPYIFRDKGMSLEKIKIFTDLVKTKFS